MSIPNTIFIDTCIIEDEGYRFESDKMSAFTAAARDKKITLLMPDPTSREILRHIKEKAEGVVSALQEAKRKAPFLKKWKEWPIKKNIHLLTYELHKMARKEWDEFLENFALVKLDYADIKMTEIMNWYDNQIPPFGPGKSKEFPDAFSFALILQYAQKNKCSVAVISRDSDFSAATDRYQEVLPFKSIAAYTQALIESDTRVKDIRGILEKDSRVLEEAIEREFPGLSFYPSEAVSGDVDDVEVDGVVIKDFKVIAVGDKHCTLAISSLVKYSAYVEYEYIEEIDEGDYCREITIKKSGGVSDITDVFGVIKLHMADDWKSVSGVNLVSIDNDDIEVTAEPAEERDYED